MHRPFLVYLQNKNAFIYHLSQVQTSYAMVDVGRCSVVVGEKNDVDVSIVLSKTIVIHDDNIGRIAADDDYDYSSDNSHNDGDMMIVFKRFDNYED